jgi:hypothetical protein
LFKQIKSDSEAMKSLSQQVKRSMPKLAKAEALVRIGDREKGLSIADDIAASLRKLQEFRSQSKFDRLDEYLEQPGMIGQRVPPLQEEMVKFFNNRGHNVQRFIMEYSDDVIAQPNPKKPILLGEPEPTFTKQELISKRIESVSKLSDEDMAAIANENIGTPETQAIEKNIIDEPAAQPEPFHQPAKEVFDEPPAKPVAQEVDRPPIEIKKPAPREPMDSIESRLGVEEVKVGSPNKYGQRDAVMPEMEPGSGFIEEIKPGSPMIENEAKAAGRSAADSPEFFENPITPPDFLPPMAPKPKLALGEIKFRSIVNDLKKRYPGIKFVTMKEDAKYRGRWTGKNVVELNPYRIRTEEEMYKVAMHEVVGHIGFRRATGQQLERVLDSFRRSFPEKIQVKMEQYKLKGNVAGQRAAAEEAIAEMAEAGIQLGSFDNIIGSIRNTVNKAFNLKMTDNDILYVLGRAKQLESPANVQRRRYGVGAIAATGASDDN